MNAGGWLAGAWIFRTCEETVCAGSVLRELRSRAAIASRFEFGLRAIEQQPRNELHSSLPATRRAAPSSARVLWPQPGR